MAFDSWRRRNDANPPCWDISAALGYGCWIFHESHEEREKRKLSARMGEMTGRMQAGSPDVRAIPVGAPGVVSTLRLMKKTTFVSLALALPFCLGSCDRAGVTSTESTSNSRSGTGAMTPPVALPDTVMGTRPQGTLADEENVKFENWCRRFGLDPKDPGMLDADPDHDGFSNREEFIAGTSPLDPNSVPGMLDGVTMKEMKEVQVPVILREVKDGKAQVERLDKPGMEEWQQGTVVTGLPYRVVTVKHEVKADKHGVFSDMSRITLENPDTKETVTLVRNLPTRSSETYAILSGTGAGEQKIHVDEVIEITGQKDKKFKVLEIRPEQVVVEEMGTRRPLTIPKRQQ